MDVVSYTVKHSLNYYMRSAYRGNVNALQEDFRGSQPQSAIVSADAKAVQRMTEKLRALNYDSDHETEILQTAQAFVKTYNNLINSSEGISDSSTSALKKKMTKILRNSKEDLSSLGIELKGDGSLSLDEEKFSEASPSKIGKYLSSDGTFSRSLRSIVAKIYRSSGKIATYNSSGKKTSLNPEENGKTVDLSL